MNNLLIFLFVLLIPDKDKEFAFLKETLSEKEKEIAHLKEELSQVQQHGQRKEFDFFKQMATIDQELRKAKKNIDEATETLVNNKAVEVEELHSKLQTFNGKYVQWYPAKVDEEQSIFPASLVRRASEKKSTRKINRRLGFESLVISLLSDHLIITITFHGSIMVIITGFYCMIFIT